MINKKRIIPLFYIGLQTNFVLLFTSFFRCVIFQVKGFVVMDKEWLKYWQQVEDLENDEVSLDEVDSSLEEAKDLYKTVLDDDN